MSIVVWGEDDLTGRYKVAPSGVITFPLLREVKAAGMTTKELDRFITEGLGRDYLVDPEVTVVVEEYRSKRAFVFGEVSKPGMYWMKGKMTLLELLSEAGGVTGKVGKKAIIARKELKKVAKEEKEEEVETVNALVVDLEGLLRKGELEKDVALGAGDIVYVGGEEEKRIFVLGAVKKPGSYSLGEAPTVLSAVLAAGGFTEYASPSKTKLVRGKETMIVNGQKLAEGDKSKDVKLEEGDLLIVPESWF